MASLRTPSFISRFLAAGTDPSYSRFDNQVYRNTNVVTLTVLVNSVGFLVLSSLVGAPQLVALSIAGFLCYLGAHLIMRAGKQTLSRFVLLLTGCLIVYIAAAYTGFLLRIHLLFISISICTLMMFDFRDGRLRVYVLAALPIALLLIGDATNYQIAGVPRLKFDSYVLPFRVFSMMATLTNIIVGVLYFHYQLAQSHREIEDYVAQIKRESQSQIQAHKMASLGEMASGMAHEINSPLTVLSIRAHQMHKAAQNAASIDQLKAEVQDGAQKILSTTNRIARIITSLRAFARLADQDPFERASIDSLAKETLEFCQQRFAHSGVKLDIEVENGLEVSCRPTQIVQVLLNLLNNAHDACKAQANARAKLEAFRDGRDVVIRVRNNGPAIPEEARGRIFEPFFTTKRPNLGTGLGLSISKGLVEDHEGTLECVSDPNETVFQVRLPQAPMGTA